MNRVLNVCQSFLFPNKEITDTFRSFIHDNNLSKTLALERNLGLELLIEEIILDLQIIICCYLSPRGPYKNTLLQ